MRPSSGRAVTANIHQRLRNVLLKGEPMTYQQLASHAGCTVRSVRNYLNHAEELFGFSIGKSRVPGSRTLLISADTIREQTPRALLRPVLGDVLFRHIFPSADGSDDHSLGIAFTDGWPAYDHQHIAVADAWIDACNQDPWQPVRLLFSVESTNHEIVLWPLTIAIHNADGILLIGADITSNADASLLRISLATVAPEQDAVTTVKNDLSLPPSSRENWIEQSHHDPLVRYDLSDETIVDVHIRFFPPIVDKVRHRIWDASQHVVFRRDGAMDLLIAQAPLGWAASLAASFGGNAEVLGNKKLRKAVKKRKFSL